ncbi:MAG TPA: Crp/Fnr family transcriptional regulator [Terriglobales bacterium]|nr:Crp/Fnr family transcriptional regulator [Terriglobales bacterium]
MTHAKQSGSLVEAASFSASDLFKGLPPAALKAIEDSSHIQDFRKGHVFFQSGESGEVLFLLEKGAVETYRTSGKKKLIIAELKPPAVFGEMGCVGQYMYHCNAQATEPSRIRTISRGQLDKVLDQYPLITRRLLDLVSQRFVHVLMDLDATSFRQLIPRLANLLLERAEGDFVRDMTHKEIAQHLRVYRESATAALGELKRAGIIEIGRKRIRILSRPRLERAARE